jgi:nucleoside-diphosphate-sugar epimerase
LSRVLLTGADGFVGRALTAHLHRSGDSILAAVRRTNTIATSGVQTVHIPDIRTASWERLLEGVDAVIHLAARAHVQRESSSNPLAEFRAAIDLFRACQAAAVERFIFVSSIGVNGKSTEGRAFSEADVARPAEPYAISKWEAEEALRAQLVRDSTKLIVIRPALIYGPYAKGNFLRLMRWIDAGWPLPFAAINARRNFLGLTSFCDLLKKCLASPFETEELFVAADRVAVSTHELIGAIAGAMNVKIGKTRVSLKWLALLAKSMGRSAEFERLSTSLEIDSTRAATMLDWRSNPALGADLQDMADVYLGSKK